MNTRLSARIGRRDSRELHVGTLCIVGRVTIVMWLYNNATVQLTLVVTTALTQPWPGSSGVDPTLNQCVS